MERSNTAAIVVVTGLVLGVALDVATFLVARYGPVSPDGGPWSFRGNGALIVPFGLGPALLAGGWTAVLLHGRAGVQWLSWGIGVFVLGALLALLSAVLTIGGYAVASGLVGLVALLWPLIAPGVLVIVHRHKAANTLRHALAQAAFTVSGLTGFVVASRVWPPGS
jgi:hypothetical protein